MKISVCLATCNGEKYIKAQLDSILCQLSEIDEVIISDDRSSDETQNIILSYADSRIKLINNKPNLSLKDKLPIYRATKNFENALRLASGDLVFLSDQDDVWEKTKVSRIKSLFENQKINIVVHDAILVDNKNQIIADSYFKIVNSRPGLMKNLFRNTYLGCSMAFDRTVLQSSLPFPKNLIAHDMWIGLIGEKIGEAVFINEKLVFYKRHESAVTTSGNKSKNSLIFKLKYRVQFIIQYFRRISSLKLSK